MGKVSVPKGRVESILSVMSISRASFSEIQESAWYLILQVGRRDTRLLEPYFSRLGYQND